MWTLIVSVAALLVAASPTYYAEAVWMPRTGGPRQRRRLIVGRGASLTILWTTRPGADRSDGDRVRNDGPRSRLGDHPPSPNRRDRGRLGD